MKVPEGHVGIQCAELWKRLRGLSHITNLQHDSGVDGGISINTEALESYLFEQRAAGQRA